MTSALRALAAGLDDAALEALASRGLVRRAAADVAAGKVAIVDEAESAAELVVDGERVSLVAAGLARSRCSCPAPGVCRHRLAAAMALRTRGDDAEASEATAATDWAAVFAAIEPAQIEAFAGRVGWRRALEFRPGATEVEAQPTGFTVKLGDAAPVLFRPAGGLAAALTKAPERKVLVAAAALAARHALGLPAPAGQAGAPVEPAARTAPALGDVRDFLARAYDLGLATAPVMLEEEARRLSLAGRVEALPRLASLLRRIAGALAAERRRGADADADQLLALLAEASALCVALERAPSPGLAGEARQAYAAIGDLEVFGLGAQVWEAPGGAHGVTSYFFAPSSGARYSFTLARPDRTDVQFEPQAAFHHSAVWGATMARLSAGRVTLSGAQASAQGRLSASGSTRARVEPWSPRRDAVRGWPCAFEDWAGLEAAMQAAFTPRLGQPERFDRVVVLIPAGFGAASFDELTQTLTWPIADAGGRWIGLSLAFEGPARERVEALERLTSAERFWAVLATAAEDAGRIDLRPYALWGGDQKLLDFTPRATGRRNEPASLIERLGRLASGRAAKAGAPHPVFLPADPLLDRAWAALLRRAELGRADDPDRRARETGELRAALDLAGHAVLARQFAALAASPPAATPTAALRAAYALSTTRRASARLLWMAPS